MLSEIRPALVILGLFTVLLGGIYPLAVTGVAKAAMSPEASGSITHDASGKENGSRLIGQPFSDPKYFWGRLSATLDANGKALPYNAGSSLGSNLGPTNPALTEMAKARIDALRAADPGDTRLVPVDLVTASASGLDPHISPAAAEFQVRRVARVRGIPEDKVRALVQANTEERTLGILGEPHVNVRSLNAALDSV